jgi:hypothetical protein
LNEEQHEKLRNFLQVEFARTEGNTCTRVDLIVPTKGFRGTSLGVWIRKEKPELFDKQSGVEDLANEIRQFVIEHVEAHSTDCRFVVTTTQHMARTQHHQFKVRYDDGEDPPYPHREELPVASGLVSQLMRQNDNQSKALLQMVTLTSHTNQRLIEELGNDNARLRRERGDMYAQVESAQNHRLERELAVQTQAAQEERKDIAMRKLLEILPIISQKLMTSGSGTGATTPAQHDEISVAVNELADLMSGDLVHQILPALDQKQQMAFFRVFELARAAKAAAAEEKPNGATAPHPA